MKELKRDYLKIKDKAYDIIENVAPLPRVWEESGEITRSQYWKNDKGDLILQAGKGRYDFYKGFMTGIFATDSVIYNPVI